MSSQYHDYLKTDYWKAVAAAVKKRADYRCQICNSQHDLQAHHRTYEHRGKELEHLADLTCLCRRCHAVFHGLLPMQPEPNRSEVVKPKASKRGYAHDEGMTNVRPHTREEVDAEMPEGAGDVFLTQQLLNKCRTNGVFTTATIEALGVSAHMAKGWVGRLVGVSMSREQFRRALEGKYIYSSKRFKTTHE